MSKKNRRNRQNEETAPVVDNVVQTDEAAIERGLEAEAIDRTEAAEEITPQDDLEMAVSEANPETVTDEPAVANTPAEPVAETPKTITRYAPVENMREFKFRRGFETVLMAEIKENGGGTVENITERLLASGEYQRVAPAAAAARPTKPVAFLLRRWVEAKLLIATELENTEAISEVAATEPVEDSELQPVAAE